MSFFIRQSYFAARKNIRLNCMHYFVMKILKKQELQQTALNHSSDIDFCQYLMNDIDIDAFQKESFRKNIKTNNDNWWSD